MSGRADELAKVLVGTDAVAKIMGDIRVKVEASEAIDLGDLQIFDAFAWLLSEEQKKQQCEWVGLVLNNTAKGAAPRKPSASAFAPAPMTG